MNANKYIVLFDADCGICSAFVSFAQSRILNHTMLFQPNDDKRINIPLNNPVLDLKDKTIILYDIANKNYFLYSEAIFIIFLNMDSKWRFIGLLKHIKIFKFAFNIAYRFVAKRRATISKFLGLNSCKISS